MTVRSFAKRMRPRLENRAYEEAWRLRAMRSRRKAVAGDGDLRRVIVRGQELYGRRVTGFSATDAAADNLRIAVEALERAGATHFLVPGISRTRHAVGVHESDRQRFLEALGELNEGRPTYLGQPMMGGRIRRPVTFLDGRLPSSTLRARVLRVGQVILGPRDQVLAGPELGCDVEFWSDGAALLESPQGEEELARVQPQASRELFARSLVAPRRNRVADVLPDDERKPATLRVGEREYATFEPFTHPTVDEVTFPVDVVYTWVDGEEPAMRRKRARYRGENVTEILDKETNESRYTSHDELKYSLRSLSMYADFVRHIHIVTDGQKPEWLNDSAPGITVVDHRDIFPDGVLPVFNSHAIETRLHHTPGISDHYLYFNDDVFVGRPITPEHFFQGNGIIRIPVSPLKIGVGDPHGEETATNSASKNVRRLLMERYGRMTVNNFMHTPLPQQRETLLELEKMFPEDIARTMRSRFRSPEDIAVTAPLHYQYAMMQGRGVPGRFNFRYVNISREDAETRLADLQRTRRFDFFCLNDVDVPEEQRGVVRDRMADFLESYFPFPSPWEK